MFWIFARRQRNLLLTLYKAQQSRLLPTCYAKSANEVLIAHLSKPPHSVLAPFNEILSRPPFRRNIIIYTHFIDVRMGIKIDNIFQFDGKFIVNLKGGRSMRLSCAPMYYRGLFYGAVWSQDLLPSKNIILLYNWLKYCTSF